MSIIYAIISLVLLALSKNFLVRQITRFIHRLGGGQRGVIITWSIIFLPGTIIHEISHFLAAALTGARTGKIEIFPEYLEDESDNGKSTVALGYVQTQSLNPIRGFLVGIAPFISGLALLIYLSSLIQDAYSIQNYRIIVLEGYLFFTIANSFFPSWPDIKQTIPFVVISIIIAIIALFFGFQLSISPTSTIWALIDSLTVAILISLFVNVVISTIIFLINKFSFRRR